MELPTQINSTHKTRILFQGAFLGGLGASWLFATGLFLPVSVLSVWGVPIFIFGITLIHFGLTPYRKINRLELSPHHIQVSKELFCYKEKGHPLFSIPLRGINRMHFIEKRKIYGIAIVMKRPIQEKVLIHHPHFRLRKLHERSLRKYQCDFFLPYFSKKTFDDVLRISLPGQYRACE